MSVYFVFIDNFSDGIVNRSDIESWLVQVPPYLQVPDPIQPGVEYDRGRLMLFLTYEWIKICIHRPFYRRTSSTLRCPSWATVATDESDRAATRILDLIRAYDVIGQLQWIPLSAIPIMFSAGTIFAYQADRLRGESRAAAMMSFEETTSLLTTVEFTWQCAGQARAILEQHRRQMNSEGGLEVRYA